MGQGGGDDAAEGRVAGKVAVAAALDEELEQEEGDATDNPDRQKGHHGNGQPAHSADHSRGVGVDEVVM